MPVQIDVVIKPFYLFTEPRSSALVILGAMSREGLHVESIPLLDFRTRKKTPASSLRKFSASSLEHYVTCVNLSEVMVT